MTACIRTTTDQAHIARVIAVRRALCVGEGFRPAQAIDTRRVKTRQGLDAQHESAVPEACARPLSGQPS